MRQTVFQNRQRLTVISNFSELTRTTSAGQLNYQTSHTESRSFCRLDVDWNSSVKITELNTKKCSKISEIIIKQFRSSSLSFKVDKTCDQPAQNIKKSDQIRRALSTAVVVVLFVIVCHLSLLFAVFVPVVFAFRCFFALVLCLDDCFHLHLSTMQL